MEMVIDINKNLVKTRRLKYEGNHIWNRSGMERIGLGYA